ncbi:ATP-grasp fold amidoligase family protein [Pseudomonas sp. NPDC008258]|uniref:ATP-grasp fold amidoligase family protein n=1 Tax=Pseudomonas sp. NPDC008258 TaxID=3364418 RepID=UPI0036EFACF6
MICTYFTDFIQAHTERSDKNRFFIDKLTTREVLTSAGLHTPSQISKFDSIEAVIFDELPDPVALKLTNLSSKAGIYLLYRVKGGYFEQLSNKLMTESEIVADIRRLCKGHKSPLIAEELVIGENGPLKIPFDYKIYTFNGNPEFILQIDRNPKIDEICFFDGNFEVITDSRATTTGEFTKLGAPAKPRNYLDMLEAAKKASKEIDRPFISVDMYTTGTDVYIGELTPTPGGPYFGSIFKFSEDFDLYLGGIMIDGYKRREWEIPEIETPPPARSNRTLKPN